MANLLKFKGPAPELIKIAINAGTEALFFDAAPDYEPIYFDAELLAYTYGDQIFTDVANQKNMVWLVQDISDPCLSKIKDFINLPTFKEDNFLSTDILGIDIDPNYVPDGTETIKKNI